MVRIVYSRQREGMVCPCVGVFIYKSVTFFYTLEVLCADVEQDRADDGIALQVKR